MDHNRVTEMVPSSGTARIQRHALCQAEHAVLMYPLTSIPDASAVVVRSIRRFVADTYSSNRSMLDVFMHTPGVVTIVTISHDGSAVHLVMPITPPPSLQTGGRASS
jgi:hypothetical protein